MAQPFLHELIPAIAAPGQAWSDRSGQIRAVGAQGVYHGDVRILARAELQVGGATPEVLTYGPRGAGVTEAVAVVRSVDEPGADPTVRLVRRRVVTPTEVTEVVEVGAATTVTVHVPLTVTLGSDLARMEQVKAGAATVPRVVVLRGDVLEWADEQTAVTVTAPGAQVEATDPLAPRLTWQLDVVPGHPVTVSWTAATTRSASPVLAAAPGSSWSVPAVECDDRRLAPLVARALDDLSGLRMRAVFAPDDVFLAAGAPWFFTLFGRDSLWAARMLLPLGTDLAAGTLRTLAARQGTDHDVDTAEQPGRILHEVRGGDLDLGGGTVLPPLYYGTVDATPLWVCLLHDAWRWGMPADEVAALLPAAEAALEWMTDHGDADGDGFLEYLDATGHGLANQGWKDSGDSVQWRDGRLATGPIALCEVQGYAYEAAMGGAALLEAFGRPGPARWRAWAADLAARFRARFWVRDDDGPYPAIALDADKRPVDALTSNIGHLLGTGLLTEAEEALVARRLGSVELDSGYGLRTMATSSAGYWPLRYHGGAVWAHDTAIAVAGLVRSGHADVAGRLADGLLTAAVEAGYQLPELYSGDARGTVPGVVPYPAACHPQAWSAASAVVLLTSFLGLQPDVPGGVLRVTPAPSPFGRLRVTGLRIGDTDVTVEIDAHGRLRQIIGPDLVVSER